MATPKSLLPAFGRCNLRAPPQAIPLPKDMHRDHLRKEPHQLLHHSDSERTPPTDNLRLMAYGVAGLWPAANSFIQPCFSPQTPASSAAPRPAETPYSRNSIPHTLAQKPRAAFLRATSAPTRCGTPLSSG